LLFLLPSSNESKKKSNKKLISRTWCTEELEEFYFEWIMKHHVLSRYGGKMWNEKLNLKIFFSFFAMSSCQYFIFWFHHHHSCTRLKNEAINRMPFDAPHFLEKYWFACGFLCIKEVKARLPSSTEVWRWTDVRSRSPHATPSHQQICVCDYSNFPIKQFRCPLFLIHIAIRFYWNYFLVMARALE
jgi:hypothetical protein